MTTVPLIKMTSEVIKSCQDIDLANRMEYLVIRNYYPKVISLFQTQKLETQRKSTRK